MTIVFWEFFSNWTVLSEISDFVQFPITYLKKNQKRKVELQMSLLRLLYFDIFFKFDHFVCNFTGDFWFLFETRLKTLESKGAQGSAKEGGKRNALRNTLRNTLRNALRNAPPSNAPPSISHRILQERILQMNRPWYTKSTSCFLGDYLCHDALTINKFYTWKGVFEAFMSVFLSL